MKYLYMDESGIMDGKYFGYGALLLDDPNELDKIISYSLLELAEADNERDKPTLERCHFHASKDSPNAHSAICNGINRLSKFKFSATFLEAGDGNTDIKRIFDASAFYGMLQLNYIREPVTIVMEQRNELNKDVFQKFFTRAYNELLLDCYRLPFFPLSFPKIEFKIADKSNSGLQLCDFLLWVSGRELRGDKTWYDRIKSPVKSRAYTANSKDYVDYSYGVSGIELSERIFYETSDYNRDFERNRDEEFFWNLFVEAQEQIKVFCSNSKSEGLPEHARHLKIYIEKFQKRKSNMPIYEEIEKTAELYLKLFDTIPIIDKTTPTEKKPRILYTKKMMGLLLRRDLGQGLRMLQFLSRKILQTEERKDTLKSLIERFSHD